METKLFDKLCESTIHLENIGVGLYGFDFLTFLDCCFVGFEKLEAEAALV